MLPVLAETLPEAEGRQGIARLVRPWVSRIETAVAYALTIWKFGRLFDVLTILRTVFGMVFGLSARFRGGIRAGLAKWATVGALVFAVVTAQAAASPFR